MRTTLLDLRRMKKAGRRIAMLTAYDYAAAKIADRAGVPILLVGDSLGMVVQGHDSTLPVTLDEMVRHAAAVVRGAESALVVGDLPFLTYTTQNDAVAAARRLMQAGGVQAVKLEGGRHVAPIVQHLVQFGVPVMAHLGFTPQSQHQLGVRVHARDPRGKDPLRLCLLRLALRDHPRLLALAQFVPHKGLPRGDAKVRARDPFAPHDRSLSVRTLKVEALDPPEAVATRVDRVEQWIGRPIYLSLRLFSVVPRLHERQPWELDGLQPYKVSFRDGHRASRLRCCSSTQAAQGR